jgi:hypothetical protein
MFVGTGSGLEAALERGRSGLGWDVDIESINFCTVRLNKCLKQREEAKNKILKLKNKNSS